MRWDEFQCQFGANLAPDGISLHYGNLTTEYHAALERAVLMDRSHEGRMEGQGRSRIDLLQRISTNDLFNMSPEEGRATILTNPIGRILDRVIVYNQGETVLITTEPGRGDAVRNYLQRQIFFNDDFQLHDISGDTRQFTLHGPATRQIIENAAGKPVAATSNDDQPTYSSLSTTIAGQPVCFLERKSVSGGHWSVIVPNEGAESVWTTLLQAGKNLGLIPAGSLTFNALRIRAGRPAAGRELSTDYIPLEAGLWDEVSFTKGCYTGQEIIARMESRSQLAKALVKLRLSKMVDAPANLYDGERAVGTLTSSVTTPTSEFLGMGFVKTAAAHAGQVLTVGDKHAVASIIGFAGSQPPKMVMNEEEAR
jgi:tRNA-modifying protein YgfZ